MPDCVSQKSSGSRFLQLVFFYCVLWLNYTILQQKCPKGQIETCFLGTRQYKVHSDPESHNAQHYRQTDGRTDGRHDDANSRSYCVAVQSANKTDELSQRRPRDAPNIWVP